MENWKSTYLECDRFTMEDVHVLIPLPSRTPRWKCEGAMQSVSAGACKVLS